MSDMPKGDETAGTLSAEDVSGDAETAHDDANEITIKERHRSRRSDSTRINVNVRTPPPTPPNEPAYAPGEHKTRNLRLIISAVLTILILAACFAGIFYGIGAKDCACQDLTGWFCGAVMAVVGWWVPSPTDEK